MFINGNKILKFYIQTYHVLALPPKYIVSNVINLARTEESYPFSSLPPHLIRRNWCNKTPAGTIWWRGGISDQLREVTTEKGVQAQFDNEEEEWFVAIILEPRPLPYPPPSQPIGFKITGHYHTI